MKTSLTPALLLLLAALVLSPGALAVEVGFGGGPGSMITKFSSTSGNAINVQNILSGDLMASAGDLIGSGDGPLEQYFEWTSWDGKEKAAAYVYLGESSGYDYAFSGTSGKNSATAKLTLSAEEVEDGLLVGGFAYNPKDYAGVATWGEGADTFEYKNALSATTSKVSATQTFYGTDLEDIHVATWAERGNMDAEAQDEEDLLTLRENGWYYFPMPFGGEWESNELLSGQDAYLDEVNMAAKKPYTATASLSSNIASSSQSVTLTGEIEEEVPVTVAGNGIDEITEVDFESYSYTGDGETGKEAFVIAGAEGLTARANDVVYSASSKATAAQSSASQTVDVKEADRIYKEAWSDDYANGLHAGEGAGADRYYEESIVDENGEYIFSYYDSGIISSMSGSDSATAKAGYASVTQKVTMSGAYLDRGLDAGNEVDGLYASADSTINDEIEVLVYDPVNDEEFTDYWAHHPAAASTLSGQSTATATLSSATVQSSGKWKATIAKDNTDYDAILDYYEGLGYEAWLADDAESSFEREGYAENPDTSSETDIYKKTIAGSKTYTFTEKEVANAADAVSS